MIRLSGVALLLVVSNAMASNWISLPLLPNSQFSSASYDRQSLKKRGSKVVFWMARSYPGVATLGDFQFDKVVDRWTIDCRDDTYASGTQTFSLNGNTTRMINETSSARPIPPDSWVEKVEQVVCN
jgi:hypothetical protein